VQRTPLEQAAVLGQQDPPLLDSAGGQVGVVGVGRPPRVETEQPQAAGEGAEPHVEQETAGRGRLRPRDGADLDDRARPGSGGGRDDGFVDPQLTGLGQRHPGRLHEVSERRIRVVREPALAGGTVPPRQQERQLRGDAHDHHPGR
jgi:hypothetical protein